MHYIWLELLKRFGFGKEWVNVPVCRYYREYEFLLLCHCQKRRMKAMDWNVTCDWSKIMTVSLLSCGTLRCPRAGLDLALWAGACGMCDRVYFGMASKKSTWKAWE